MRIAVAWKAFFLRGEARLARYHELRTLDRLGALLPSKLEGTDAEARAVVGRARTLDAELASHSLAAQTSWALDRRDYAQVPGWARSAVIGRGILERTVQRSLTRRRLQDRRAVLQQLAALAVAGRVVGEPGNGPLVPTALGAELAELRTDARTADQTRAALLAPYGGQALPGWIHAISREFLVLVAIVGGELRGKLLPRLPALGGLAAGWWITHTFTDSHVDAALSHLGLRHGGSRVVSSERLQQMSFWLPLVIGATCSYLSARLSGFIQRRYAPLPDPAPSAVSVDPQAAATVMLAVPGGPADPHQG
jgi:hypothetical protein